MDAMVTAVPLLYGHYDQVAFIETAGLEQYRTLSGSKAGPDEQAQRVSTTRISFSLPRDPALLQKAIAAVVRVHSYEEPVLYITELWRTRALANGSKNPNKWWNRRDLHN